MTPGQQSHNAVSNARRQWIRPFANGLVAHTERSGSRSGGAAKKFDGRCLEHAVLNHSSLSSATIVHARSVCFDTMRDEPPYLARLKMAMGIDGSTPPHDDTEMGDLPG